MYSLGLMSGTSADGVDVVLAEFTGHPQQPTWKILNFSSIPYPSNLRGIIIELGQGITLSACDLLGPSEAITEVYSKAAGRHGSAAAAQGSAPIPAEPGHFPKRPAGVPALSAPQTILHGWRELF